MFSLALRFFAETTPKQIESSIQTVIAIENNYSIWREIIYTGLVGFSSLAGVERAKIRLDRFWTIFYTNQV